jgi:hypothetical protein
MMEESDLEKMDPKRTELEQDRIILEFIKNSLHNYLDLLPSKLENDEARLKTETDTETKVSLQFKIQQKKLLLKLIDFYNEELNKLIKDDSL